jgi:hypothetical protein
MLTRADASGRVAATALVLAVAGACARGPGLPREMTFEGSKLEKATTWSSQGVSGVVFVPPGERLPSASLQVGVLASRKHASGADLHRWIMDQYRRSPTVRYHESTTADEACKIGVTDAGGPRPFLALHVCRARAGVAACAEVDERMVDNDVGRCLTSTADCWEELCGLRWLSARASLEPILDDVLKR